MLHTVVRKNAVVGAKPEDCANRDEWGIAVVGENSVIDEGAVVKPKEMIDRCTEVKANEM